MNWSDKYAKNVALVVKGNECESLSIVTHRAQRNINQFIESHVKYCEKVEDGDCFGERPMSRVKKERKLKWEDTGNQPTAPAKCAVCRNEWINCDH